MKKKELSLSPAELIKRLLEVQGIEKDEEFVDLGRGHRELITGVRTAT